MTWASCAQRIEKVTIKLPGVMSSNVNLATEEMQIEFKPEYVSISNIIQAVSHAGYEAHEDIETAGSNDEDREKKQRESKNA